MMVYQNLFLYQLVFYKVIAPYLFIIVMDYIMRLAIRDYKNYGFEYSKRKSSSQPAQKIADDLALISGDIKEMQNMLD